MRSVLPANATRRALHKIPHVGTNIPNDRRTDLELQLAEVEVEGRLSLSTDLSQGMARAACHRWGMRFRQRRRILLVGG